MSGAVLPYPRFGPGAAPGQNSIGQFQIGVSPIGTISPFDVYETVLSQYADSPILLGMITAFNAAMDPTQYLDNVFDMLWNVQTAQGYGLDVWGRIVGVTRALAFPGTVTYLGFEEAGASWTGFGQGILFSGGATTTNFNLTDHDFRSLIMAKAASNVSSGSIPAINAILLALFGGGWVTDGLNMTMTYTFPFPLTAVQQAIIAQTGVLPTPCGVVATVVQL